MRPFIYEVVEAFYRLATTDILIGYHFHKFKDETYLREHLERITSFWEMQLSGKSSVPFDPPFQLLLTHLPMRLNIGELGRWITLFHRVLNEKKARYNEPEIDKIIERWIERIALFEEKFKDHPQMFKRV